MDKPLIDNNILHNTFTNTRRRLLDARTPEGIWAGRLSSSPLATAVAVFALYTVDSDKYDDLIWGGLAWLADHQQEDGSWGDAEKLDPGNISTTLLCYAVFSAVDSDAYPETLEKTKKRLIQYAGNLTPAAISKAVYAVYGKDRTFAVPILTMCALAGVLGPDGWQYVKPLPFELAVLPRSLFRWLKLSVVSYALPALIAMGQVKYHFDRPANPIARGLRKYFKERTLKRLQKIQPTNGGFLEATPLTSFVVMSLASMELKDHPVVSKGIDFIIRSVRADGSWPIDTNLSTWVTSLSVEALLPPGCESPLSESEKKSICDWYLAQQYDAVHPYTTARPGGWGWTNLPGGVPDADDTAGALVALHQLRVRNEPLLFAVSKGIRWLLDLQNADGGIPTFCRGWGRLEFDRSCPDITAHAITAWQLWKDRFDPRFKQQIENAIWRALNYLETVQRDDGAWLPLWFGNPCSQSKDNPVYGTARVIWAFSERNSLSQSRAMLEKGGAFLMNAQNTDGGWGAEKGQRSTIEETALAIDALSAISGTDYSEPIHRGVHFLIETTQQGTCFKPSANGLYFAKLWYAERLYPVIFSLKALRKALSRLS